MPTAPPTATTGPPSTDDTPYKPYFTQPPHQENYHEFCRLLGRLKANYQLCELVRTEGFSEWCDLAAAFTVKSFQQWQWFANRCGRWKGRGGGGKGGVLSLCASLDGQLTDD
jgi:hypothetical protein